MIPVPSGVRVWLAVGRTDMRRGMNGLALQVQEALGRDPHAGDLYVFRGVASPAPHRPGRADFPHPVLHAQASLTEQHIGGRSSPKAVGALRAWFGSVTTANCCAALAA